jgi:membrane fusion protein (multidrug efflux system)
MKKINKKYVVLGAVILVLLVFEWRPWHGLPDAAPTPLPVSEVVEEESTANLYEQDIRAQLSAVAYTTIAAELNARIHSLRFKEGQVFKAGQVLVEFDCAAQRAQLQKTKALLSIAARNYEANRELLALGSVGRIESENSYSEYLKFKAEHDEMVSIIHRCSIVAPYSGMVFEQKAREEQYVQAGQPVMEILDNSALELEFIVPSKWSYWLVKGYQFNIKLDETEKTYPAEITRVNGKIDSVSQTLKVAAVINGHFPEISPGMSGVIMIEPPAESKSTSKALPKPSINKNTSEIAR